MDDGKVPVPFNVSSGAPTTLTVHGIDGRVYAIRLAVAVFDVRDNGDLDDPARFDVHAELAFSLEEVG